MQIILSLEKYKKYIIKEKNKNSFEFYTHHKTMNKFMSIQKEINIFAFVVTSCSNLYLSNF